MVKSPDDDMAKSRITNSGKSREDNESESLDEFPVVRYEASARPNDPCFSNSRSWKNSKYQSNEFDEQDVYRRIDTLMRNCYNQASTRNTFNSPKVSKLSDFKMS